MIRAIAAFALVLAVVAVVAVAGSDGQGPERASGRFPVALEAERFALRRLAGEKTLTLHVTNRGTRAIPNVVVTLDGLRGGSGEKEMESLRPRLLLVAGPEGTDVDRPFARTFALGRVAPGERATYRWRLRALRRGPYRIRFDVRPDLGGDATAVVDGGRLARGAVSGVIAERPVGPTS
ncbi:MAG TPA: hypothetical protein VD931_00425 [Baekduia sp.]|nr:hypothetical protein [Baekduia sp.]